MLLSQRIAKEPNFLRSNWRRKGLADYLFDLRLKIIRSTKVLVGRELMDHERSAADMAIHVFGHPPTEAEEQKRYELYLTYGRSPFPAMAIENESGILFVETIEEFGFRAVAILPSGIVYPLGITAFARPGSTEVSATTFEIVPKASVERQYALQTGKSAEEFNIAINSVLFNLATSALEVMLFLNVKNAELQRYQPTKKENEAIPKPLIPHYTYHILDIYREKRSYASLKEIEEQVCKEHARSQSRRAHFVRGHFKRTKTGLFWWSPFVRNSRNQQTDGMVDKDYRLITEQKETK